MVAVLNGGGSNELDHNRHNQITLQQIPRMQHTGEEERKPACRMEYKAQ